MALNLQSKPKPFPSQSALLLSMSQILQVRNYLQFSIWGYNQIFLIISWNRETERKAHKR